MGDIEITTCPPSNQREALELVLSAVPTDQRSSVVDSLRPLAEQGVDVFLGLIVARSGNEIVGAAWLQPQVGRTGTLWPAVTTLDAFGSLRRDLAAGAMKAGAELPVDLVQTLLESGEDPFATDLRAIGFTQLAELLYLSLTVSANKDPATTDSRLRLSPRAADNRDLLESLLSSSYEGTLDCPAIEELRGFDDTIAGYQAVGSYDESLWFVVRWEDQPAGVLLLAPYLEVSQWELIYMGVSPEFRGLGIGGLILEDIRQRALATNVEQVVLAVDAANLPAKRLYEAAGYVEWSRRTAFLKPLLEDCAG
jgi:mycothiol synthase